MSELARQRREKEIFLEYLRKNGLKRTAQKELILDVFLQTEGHLSVEDIYKLVKQRDPSIGFVTVYRTLKTLTACGLAREVDLGDGRTRFEHFYDHPHHHHIICTSCKRTIEFLSTDLEELQEEIIRHYNFEPVYHSFQIYGICSDCRDKRTPPRAERSDTDSNQVLLRDALRMFINVETRGLNFYLAAAEKIKNPSGRMMFYKIAEDEREHLRRLRAEYDRLMQKNKKLKDKPLFLHFNTSLVKSIFPSKHDVDKLISENTDALQALSIAIEAERESFQAFQAYAERFSEAKVFASFSAAEKEHLNALEQEYERLAKEMRQSDGSQIDGSVM